MRKRCGSPRPSSNPKKSALSPEPRSAICVYPVWRVIGICCMKSERQTCPRGIRIIDATSRPIRSGGISPVILRGCDIWHTRKALRAGCGMTPGPFSFSGCGRAWLIRRLREPETAGSNPAIQTECGASFQLAMSLKQAGSLLHKKRKGKPIGDGLRPEPGRATSLGGSTPSPSA